MKVKELLSGPEKWTKGISSRRIDGMMSDVWGPDAVCWCLAGAIWKCYPPEQRRTMTVRLCKKIPAEHAGCFQTSDVTKWNDAPERTFEEVKALVEELDI